MSSVDDLSSVERRYLLDKILTPSEKTMLAKRLAILQELGKGGTYEEIENRYKVISITVSRMSSILRGSPQLLAILSKIDRALRKERVPKSTPRRGYGSRTIAGTKRIFGL